MVSNAAAGVDTHAGADGRKKDRGHDADHGAEPPANGAAECGAQDLQELGHSWLCATRRDQLGLLTKGEDLPTLLAGEASGRYPEVVELGELGVLARRVAPRLSQLLRALLFHPI